MQRYEYAQNECPICIQPMKTNDDIRLTDCQHTFHAHCLAKWLLEKNTWPLCRINISRSIEFLFLIKPNLKDPVRSCSPKTHLWNLNLSGQNIMYLRGIDQINEVAFVCHAFFSGNNITVLPAGVFQCLSNLEVLLLDENPIKEVEQGAFNGLVKLREVFFKNHCLSLEQQKFIKEEIAAVTDNQATVYFE